MRGILFGYPMAGKALIYGAPESRGSQRGGEPGLSHLQGHRGSQSDSRVRGQGSVVGHVLLTKPHGALDFVIFFPKSWAYCPGWPRRTPGIDSQGRGTPSSGPPAHHALHCPGGDLQRTPAGPRAPSSPRTLSLCPGGPRGPPAAVAPPCGRSLGTAALFPKTADRQASL